MRSLSIALIIILACVGAFADGHFNFAGPMSQFLPDGVTPGAVTAGLPFDIVLTDGGAAITPARFELKSPGWKGMVTMALEGARFADGHLMATIHLENNAGSTIEGVRLDITGATEEYTAKDDQGKDIRKTRAQDVSIASPLLFGDIPTGIAADPQALEVHGIAFQPETTRVTVAGLLSGLYYAGSFTSESDDCCPVSLAFDAKGRLYFADKNQSELYRCTADGKDITGVAKLPDVARDIAVDPTNGDIMGEFLNGHVALCYTPGGDDHGQMPPDGEFDDWPGVMRFDRAGNFYIIVGGEFCCYTGGKLAWSMDKIGYYKNCFDNGSGSFDVGADGVIWVTNGNDSILFRIDPNGRKGQRVASGPDWHLGHISSPRAVRVDARGNVYVIEGSTDDEAQRVTVFDQNGKFLRVFGRGAKTPRDNGLWDGQISKDASDIAIGPDGRIYIANNDTPDSILVFLPFGTNAGSPLPSMDASNPNARNESAGKAHNGSGDQVINTIRNVIGF